MEVKLIRAERLPVFLTGDFNEPSHLDWTTAAANAKLCPLPVTWPSSKAVVDAGFVDAYEWVEAPNTIGMSQFADGGVVGSKPYAASGAYIDRMSDYCAGCAYDVKRKSGEGACPFNPLYWDFLIRNRDTLGRNARLGRIYANWDRMDGAKKDAARASAAAILNKLDAGGRI